MLTDLSSICSYLCFCSFYLCLLVRMVFVCCAKILAGLCFVVLVGFVDDSIYIYIYQIINTFDINLHSHSVQCFFILVKLVTIQCIQHFDKLQELRQLFKCYFIFVKGFVKGKLVHYIVHVGGKSKDRGNPTDTIVSLLCWKTCFHFQQHFQPGQLADFFFSLQPKKHFLFLNLLDLVWEHLGTPMGMHSNYHGEMEREQRR